MTIKIGSKITKLDPADTYKLIDGDDVAGFTEVKQSVQQSVQKVDALTDSQRVLKSDIDQKLSGLIVSDTSGNSFNAITEIAFRGGVAQLQPGTTKVQIRIDPQFNVSNGATPDVSQQMDASALRFIDATITADPRDPKIAVISFPATGGGQPVTVKIPVEVGATEYAAYKRLKFDSFTASFDSNSGTLTLTPPPSSGGGASTLILDNGAQSIGGIVTIEVPTAQLTAKGSGVVELIPFITLRNGMANSSSADNASDEITLMPPLKTYGDSNSGKSIMEIDHRAYEFQHAANFLAYLSEDIEVVGKRGTGRGHHDGAVWFDNVVVPSGSYIQLKPKDKTYGIQEYDDLDPNVTGGMAYLVAFRIALKGKAPDDGIVRAYLWEPAQDNFLKDNDGQLLAVERSYKLGETLGTLEVMGILRASGLREFSCHVMDTFIDDTLVLEDRTEGASAIMIQALTDNEKTGAALLQFEQDTGQRILFSSHYMGPSRMSLNWLLNVDMPDQTGAAGTGLSMADGVHFYNPSPAKIGIHNKELAISSANDGSITDFSLGKVFSAEETAILSEHDINVNLVLTAKDCGYKLALVKWSGAPDEYTQDIIVSRNNDQPVFAPGWSLVDDFGISEDITGVDRQITQLFTIPADARNYGVIIYPVAAQNPIDLRIKGFSVDVVKPFTGYYLKAPELLTERHLYTSVEFARVTMVCPPGYTELRYTINDTPAEGLPMPVGILRKGDLPITTDASINRISGFAGEGVLNLTVEGTINIQTSVQLYAGEAVADGTTATVDFWYARKAVGDGKFTEVPESRTQFTVTGGSKIPQFAKMALLDTVVEVGDRFGLFAKASIKDGAYIQAGTAGVLVDTSIKFAESKYYGD